MPHRSIRLNRSCFLNTWKAMGIQIQSNTDTCMSKAFSDGFRIAPCSRYKDAIVCLRTCNLTPSRPIRLVSRLKARVNVEGSRGEPSG